MANEKSPTAMVFVGTAPQTVKAVQDAILAILRVPSVDNSTKKAALAALKNIVPGPNNTTISNCNFTSNK